MVEAGAPPRKTDVIKRISPQNRDSQIRLRDPSRITDSIKVSSCLTSTKISNPAITPALRVSITANQVRGESYW